MPSPWAGVFSITVGAVRCPPERRVGLFVQLLSKGGAGPLPRTSLILSPPLRAPPPPFGTMQLQCVERYLPKVVPGTSDWDLAWNKGLCSCNYGKNLEMRSSWIGVALNPVIGVLTRERKEEKAERH